MPKDMYDDYSNSRNFEGDTFEVNRVPSARPFVSPKPQDPLGMGSAEGDMAFGTGPVVANADGTVETWRKEARVVSGGSGVAGGTP